MADLRACNLCGATEGVRLYLGGHRCPACTPAALAGHPEPPDPSKTAPVGPPVGVPRGAPQPRLYLVKPDPSREVA